MSKKRILIMIPMKYRDLPGCTLIKVLLELKGFYEVILVQLSTLNPDELLFYIIEFRPHAVIYSFINSDKKLYETRKIIHDLGIRIIFLLAEGVSFNKSTLLWIAGKYWNLQYIDMFFIWNKYMEKLIYLHANISHKKCITVGVPRFDLYHPNYKDFLMTKQDFCQKYKLDPKKKIITWSTNFGFAIHKDNEQAIKNIEIYNNSENIKRDVSKISTVEYNSRDVSMSAVLDIAHKFPDINIVIKIHPSEKIDWYLEKVKNLSKNNNIIVMNDEYIWHVLNVSDIHLHRSCTTSIEAWLLNKPTIELQLLKGDWYFFKKILTGGNVAYSKNDLIKLIKYYIDGGCIPSKQLIARKKIIEWCAYKCDGQSAIRCVEAIHALLSSSINKPKIPKITMSYVIFIIKRQIKSLFNIPHYISFIDWLRSDIDHQSRTKFFTKKEELELTKKIKSILNCNVK